MNNDRIDLHIHTSASDGTWTADEAVAEIIKNNISMFAITDHNSIENVEKAAELAMKAGLAFIPGVEIDTSFNGANLHILGYGIDINNDSLLKLISGNRDLMEEKDEESIKYLCKKGFDVSLSDYAGYQNNPKRGGWKALNYLIDKKLCSNIKDFFSLFVGWGNPFSKMEFPSPKQIISVVKNAGGIAVLAHPGAPFYQLDYKDLLPGIKDEGIMGIECYHPENNSVLTKYCSEFCQANNLFITGGSDCHGTFFTAREIGIPSIMRSSIKLDI